MKSSWQQLSNEPFRFSLRPGMHLHLVGIGGAGMSAIARVLLGRGYRISGSDQQLNELTVDLQAAGALVYQGHQAAHIGQAQALVISSAIPDSNLEVMAAREADIPVLKRADVLGQLMQGQIGIAIAGSHGKTTTGGMIAHVLIESGLDPTVVLGGSLPALGTNGRHGESDYFIVEADEYDHMFLGLRPVTAVVTNVEYDHPDVFASAADYRSAFQVFVSLLPADGRLIACSDDEGVRLLLSDLAGSNLHVTTYGMTIQPAATGQAPDYMALESRPNQLGGTDFLVEKEGRTIGLARIRVPGQHNVRNALAAIIVALNVGLEFDDICRSLAGFGGIGRRFQIIGEVGGVTIVDDYAHHPTEIQATLAAARERFTDRPVWAVWQPHTFSRTKMLLPAFAGSFAAADHVVVLDIYRSRERELQPVSSGDVVAAMSHRDAVYVGDLQKATRYLLDRVRPHDVILTLGAGDGNLVGQWLLTGLQERVGR